MSECAPAGSWRRDWPGHGLSCKHCPVHATHTTSPAAPASRCGFWLLVAGGVSVPASLLWDFSWESTIGVDLFWAPPHVLTYVAILLAALGALWSVARWTGAAAPAGVSFGRLTAPLGAWLVLWSVLAFGTAVAFDRWWQSAYGLGAGIWHPPQILKAASFFGVAGGVWLWSCRAEDSSGGAALVPIGGGLMLAMIHIVTLTSSYPNHQHSASFHQLACATYPVVLAALAIATRWRWAATTGALVYSLVVGSAVWLLPLISAKPQVGPIYNPLDHLMPPPFPLLLLVPAMLMDGLINGIRWRTGRGAGWKQTAALGAAFFLSFIIAQWFFAEFLLSPKADNGFFAGGGRHWPFFLKISPAARTAFWTAPNDQFDGRQALMALGWALTATRLGLWLGAWMNRRQR